MGDVHAGDTETLLDPANLTPHPHPQEGIQVGKRLIKKQDLGVDHQCACQGNPLLLPAG